MRSFAVFRCLAAIVFFFAPLVCKAALINPNDYLVSGQFNGVNALREYTPSGTLVQSITFQYPGGYRVPEFLRDVVVDANGVVDAYNGTFTPYLTRYDSSLGTFSHQTMDGLSTAGNGTYGGIATIANYVFMTDMATFGSATQPLNGIVRFDLNGSAPVRFANGIDFIDLNVGLDGKLYGLLGNTVNVYDPFSLTLLRTIILPFQVFNADLRGLAVDPAGTLYFAAWDGTVYKLAANGALLSSLATGFANLTDIDVNTAGTLLVASRFGSALVGNTALSGFSVFANIPISQGEFVAFGQPTIIPEPGPFFVGALVSIIAAGTSLNRMRWRFV